MTEALFLHEGDAFLPTDLARGPWSPDALHGGPVAALLARCIERFSVSDEQPMHVARLTIELTRPVPVAPLTVELQLTRPGRRVQLVDISLRAGEVEVTRATALRIRTAAPMEVPPVDDPPLPGPEQGGPRPDRQWEWPAFHHMGVEMRFLHGGNDLPGPSTVWMRLLAPVVAGEELTPLQRAAAVADFGNGISSSLDFETSLYINPDLTISLHRLPVGEWVCLDAVTRLAPFGMGVAESQLYDEQGPIGRAVQSLLVGQR